MSVEQELADLVGHREVHLELVGPEGWRVVVRSGRRVVFRTTPGRLSAAVKLLDAWAEAGCVPIKPEASPCTCGKG